MAFTPAQQREAYRRMMRIRRFEEEGTEVLKAGKIAGAVHASIGQEAAVIKSMNHVGISVSDLDRAIEFYGDLLGMDVLVRASFGGEVYEAITGLPGARGEGAMLRSGDLQVELFKFDQPHTKPSETKRRVSEHGISHFCIEVSDVQYEYDRLKAAGVQFHCAPQVFGQMRATYGRDPDGNVFELLELPVYK